MTNSESLKLYLICFTLAFAISVVYSAIILYLFGKDILTASALGFIAGYFFRKKLYS